MKLIEPKVELLQQGEGLVGMYKHIEKCARTCYKSEDKITEDSYKKMYDNLVQRGHLAMLEHGTIYLKKEVWSLIQAQEIVEKFGKYSKHNLTDWVLYITTNMRVIIENHLEDWIDYICEPTEFHERRITLKFTTNIGVTREGNRHRVNSIAEESTRYCDYSKGTNGGELNIVPPVWIDKAKQEAIDKVPMKKDWLNIIRNIVDCEDKCVLGDETLYYGAAIFFSNICYNKLRTLGWSPQQAREILPLATKSEVVYTAFASDWKHWFDLRLFGTTGKPHPNMKEIAELAQQELIKNNLWDLIYNLNKKEN